MKMTHTIALPSSRILLVVSVVVMAFFLACEDYGRMFDY